MKNMLQNKQSDQFDSLRLTHVVDVVSVDVLLLLSGKSGKRLKMREKYQWPANKAKANVTSHWIVSHEQKVSEKSGNF